MMLDWLYRLIHFRQRRMVVLRLRRSFIVSEASRLIKHQAGSDGRFSIVALGDPGGRGKV
jgi:hypothetical protein